MNGSEAAKDSNLLDVADHGHDLESLALGVDGVEAPHQVLQEQLKGLGTRQINDDDLYIYGTSL